MKMIIPRCYKPWEILRYNYLSFCLKGSTSGAQGTKKHNRKQIEIPVFEIPVLYTPSRADSSPKINRRVASI